MVLAFCTIASRGIFPIELTRTVVALSQNGINCQSGEERIGASFTTRVIGSIREFTLMLLYTIGRI
jgi:hypothetical protein